MTLTAGRLRAHIAQVQERIDERLDADGIADLDKTLALSLEEYVRFQEIKSLACADGTLDLDAGMIVYAALGGSIGDPANGGWGAETTLATKVTLTQLFGELLARRTAA